MANARSPSGWLHPRGQNVTNGSGHPTHDPIVIVGVRGAFGTHAH